MFNSKKRKISGTMVLIFAIIYIPSFITYHEQIQETQIMPQQDKLNPKPSANNNVTHSHPEVMDSWVSYINELIRLTYTRTAEKEIIASYPQMPREQQLHVAILLATDWNRADIVIPKSFLIEHINYK